MIRISFVKQFALLLVLIFGIPFVGHAQTATINLVWEADSYTPPFYAGKALPTNDATVDVFALLPTSFGDPTRAKYTWELNGQVLGSLSGIGKSSLRVSGSPFIVNRMVRVSVTGINGREGFGFVNIPITKPRVLVYKDSALGGVLFSKSLTDSFRAEIDTDITLTAYPYFFSTNSREVNLSYAWEVDGQNTDSVGASFTARSEGVGTSTISVTTRSHSHVLEQASNLFSIILQ